MDLKMEELQTMTLADLGRFRDIYKGYTKLEPLSSEEPARIDIDHSTYIGFKRGLTRFQDK